MTSPPPFDRIATRVLDLAEEAAGAGTFGVGGALLGRDGVPLAWCRNQVLRHGELSDPTGHVERQLVDWLLRKIAAGDLDVRPQDVLIVSSLEPCAMCMGAILTAGLSCVALAADDTAGMGAHRPADRARMPAALADAISDAYLLASHPEAPARITTHGLTPPDQDAIRGYEDRSTKAFAASLAMVRRKVGGGRTPVDPQPSQDAVAGAGVVIENGGAERVSLGGRDHDRESPVADVFIRLRQRFGAPPEDEACALVSAAGEVIVAGLGRRHQSAARLPALEVIRAFVHAKPALVGLFGDAALAATDLRFVFSGRFRSDAEAVLSFGAIGSFYERPVQGGAGGICGLDWSEATIAEYNRLLAALPRFYTEYVGLTLAPAPRATPSRADVRASHVSGQGWWGWA